MSKSELSRNGDEGRVRTCRGLETGRHAGGWMSRGGRRKRGAYDVGIDEARYDEFALFQVYEGIVL